MYLDILCFNAIILLKSVSFIVFLCKMTAEFNAEAARWLT